MNRPFKEKIQLLVFGSCLAIGGSFLAFLADSVTKGYVASAAYGEHLADSQVVRTLVIKTGEDISEIKGDIRWLRRNTLIKGKQPTK